MAKKKQTTKNEKIKKDEKQQPEKQIQKTKTKKNQQEEKINQKDEISKLIKIVLIVTGIMLVFYGITLLVTTKSKEVLDNKTTTETSETAEIQYDNIMIGTMLNYKGTYYVLIEKKDDNRLSEYDSLIQTIESSEDAPKIYKANLTDSFNKNYLGKEQNYYVDNIADFKVTGTTLIKIKDGQINSVQDTYDTIKNTLKELA